MSDQAPTLLDFLRIAVRPVGRVLYVWGGGWNEEDTGAGTEALSLGMPGRWDTFFVLQAKKGYDFHAYPNRIHDGLDCSGYIGWALYNLLQSKYNAAGYVFPSTDIARELATLGLGACLEEGREAFSLPGDIVSMKGHVYLSLGCCKDRTALFLHASPPGVSLCGTEGNCGDEASRLAQSVMKSACPEYFALFGYRGRDHAEYTESVEVFRFSEEILPDLDGVRNCTPSQIAKVLFSEQKECL